MRVPLNHHCYRYSDAGAAPFVQFRATRVTGYPVLDTVRIEG